MGNLKNLILPVIAVSGLLLLSACGDTIKKTTDDDDMKAKATVASACLNDTFAACASAVLAGSGLSQSEVTELSSCDFEAAPKSTDSFEAARAAVHATCN